MKRQILPIIAVALAYLSTQHLQADTPPSGYRRALLIGNEGYGKLTMKGATASLDKVSATLSKQGFTISRHMNPLTKDRMQSVCETFARSIRTNGIAVVYYFGLGANIERLGKNYNALRPISEKIENDNDYRSRSYLLRDLLEQLREISGARVNIVFLDACWESPIKPTAGAISNGFKATNVDVGTALIYGAPNATALQLPQNVEASPLSIAFAKHARVLDGSVEQLISRISSEAGNAWYEVPKDIEIGANPRHPVINNDVEKIRAGKAPGEGYVNSIGMTFRWCPPGTSTIGGDTSTSDTTDRRIVKVTLSNGFWMGEHEVTQREYKVITRKNLLPGFTTHRNAPYYGATEKKSVDDFCKRLTEFERKSGALPKNWSYVCPTEAEWEYACRAGSEAKYCFGSDVNQLAKFGNFADAALLKDNANMYWAHKSANDGIGQALAPVGSYFPNAWGIRDMHGNVAEIVADHLVAERTGGIDPLVRAKKNGVTQTRGGAWCSLPLYCESSFRNGLSGRDKKNFVGFRIVLKQAR